MESVRVDEKKTLFVSTNHFSGLRESPSRKEAFLSEESMQGFCNVAASSSLPDDLHFDPGMHFYREKPTAS